MVVATSISETSQYNFMFPTTHIFINKIYPKRVSDFCLTPTQQYFSYIMAGTS